jgi:hypothetical protein
MSDATADFGAKLTLVLKHLSQSRGRLASTLGVHKSLVGRWAGGSVRPSDHNLALLTQFVQRSIPRFTLLSWEEDLASFAGLIGAIAVEQPAMQQPAGRETLGGHLFTIGAESRSETLLGGPLYCGMYRMYRTAFSNSGALIIHNFAIRFDGEHMTFRSTDGVYDHEGPVLLLRGQLFFIAESCNRRDEMFFAIVNGVEHSKALRLDGVLLSVAGDRNHTPGAMVMVLERQADLAPGEREDDAEWERWRPEIHRLNSTAAAGDLVPPELRRVLENRVGVPRSDGSVDHLLRVPFERSVCLSEADVETGPPTPEPSVAVAFPRPIIVSRS